MLLKKLEKKLKIAVDVKLKLIGLLLLKEWGRCFLQQV
ncbi:hypothetical protein ANH9381_1723 [Aggregatibacter actinomycetemcomitans ANH9381]|nr:hypothetical protein ANH9381_1723 [Aggregatibacter actinomycetemcomitans ANH9381]